MPRRPADPFDRKEVQQLHDYLVQVDLIPDQKPSNLKDQEAEYVRQQSEARQRSSRQLLKLANQYQHLTGNFNLKVGILSPVYNWNGSQILQFDEK